MTKLMQLAISDLKLIFRDSSLRIFLMLPIFIFLLVLLGLPFLIEEYVTAAPFVPVILMGSTVQASTMFGFIYSMVLIDEKDLNITQVYGILPVSKIKFILTRLTFPFLFSTLVTLLLLMTQPFYDFRSTHIFALAFLCGLVTPTLTLLVSIASKNKMIGMTWFKLVNLVITLPLAAFFIPDYAYFFSVIPTHWIYQVLDDMIRVDTVIWKLIFGYFYFIVLLIIFTRRFTATHFAEI